MTQASDLERIKRVAEFIANKVRGQIPACLVESYLKNEKDLKAARIENQALKSQIETINLWNQV